jgi:hypothetical protein
MLFLAIVLYLGISENLVACLRYAPEYADWNLNTNQEAEHPLEYSGA